MSRVAVAAIRHALDIGNLSGYPCLQNNQGVIMQPRPLFRPLPRSLSLPLPRTLPLPLPLPLPSIIGASEAERRRNSSAAGDISPLDPGAPSATRVFGTTRR